MHFSKSEVKHSQLQVVKIDENNICRDGGIFADFSHYEKFYFFSQKSKLWSEERVFTKTTFLR